MATFERSYAESHLVSSHRFANWTELADRSSVKSSLLCCNVVGCFTLLDLVYAVAVAVLWFDCCFFVQCGWLEPPARLRAAPLALFGLGNLFQIKIARQEEDQ